MLKMNKWLSGSRRQTVSSLSAPLAEISRGLKRAILKQRAPRDVFTRIAETNAWEGTESVSGLG